MMITEQGQSIRFPEGNLRIASRNSGGVRGMTLEGKDRIVGMEIIRPGDDVLVIGQKGFGKRTPETEYPRQSRGGKGVKTMQVTDKTGRVADFKIVKDGDRLLISTAHGIVIRMPIDETIRQIGRNTQGVRLIRLDDGDEVRAIERVRKPEGVRKPRSTTHSEAMDALMGGTAFADADARAAAQEAEDEEDEIIEEEEGGEGGPDGDTEA
jgi:DNA gyrase subunit A